MQHLRIGEMSRLRCLLSSAPTQRLTYYIKQGNTRSEYNEIATLKLHHSFICDGPDYTKPAGHAQPLFCSLPGIKRGGEELAQPRATLRSWVGASKEEPPTRRQTDRDLLSKEPKAVFQPHDFPMAPSRRTGNGKACWPRGPHRVQCSNLPRTQARAESQ